MSKIIDENRVKEKLSEHYSGILFHLDGYEILKQEHDDGVDLSLKFTVENKIGGKTFRNASGEIIDIQLKSTTERKIKRTSKHIVYNINVKSYNKLIARVKEANYTPYVLMLLILPEQKDKWVTLKKNSLSLSNNAYWYIPPKSMDYELIKKDTSTVALNIPTDNKLEKNTFEKLFKLIPE